MKKKLFTLMTLLLCAVTGAWADTTYEYYCTSDGTVNTDNKFSGTSFSTSPYNSVASYTYTNAADEEITCNKLVKLDSNGSITFTTSATSTVTVFAVSKNNSSGNNIKLDETIGTNGATENYTTFTETFENVSAGSHTLKRSSKEIGVIYVKVVEQSGGETDTRTNLVGAWSATAPSFEYGASATIPTFTVNGGTAGTDYSVAYTLESGNNVTVDGNGIKAIDTSTAGTSIVKATINVINETDYKATTSEYTTTITVNEEVTGPSYKSDFTDGEVIWTPTSVIDAACTGATPWMVLGAQVKSTDTKDLSGKSLVNPENEEGDRIVKYETSTNFYIQNTSSSSNDRSLSMYVTGVAKLSLYVWCNSTPDNRKMTVEVNGTTEKELTFASGDYNAKYVSVNLTKADNNIVRIYGSNQLELYAIKVNTEESTEPELTVDATASITATESGVEATETIDITGVNLTGSTLTATLNPAVEGLSVALASDIITGGEITTTAILSYTATANASGTTILTISDGTTSKAVTVTYTANVISYIQEDVSEATTWSIMDDVTGSDVHGTYDDIYANIAGLTFKNSFNAKSLHVKTNGAYVFRSGNKASQGAVLSFNATKAGKVTVYFSNNGSGSNKAIVNGTTGEDESTDGGNSGNNAKVSTFDVEAGTVTITGTSPNAIRVYKVIYTPSSATIAPAYEKTTYVTTMDLDFSGVEGLTAFVAQSASAAGVKMVSVDAVPAGTPLMLKGTANQEYTVPVAATTPAAPATNLLKAGDGTTEFNGTTYDYLLYSDGMFYQISDGTIAVGKAYLHLESAPADAARGMNIIFEDNDATGINAVEKKQQQSDDVYYNIAGQRVAQPQKGLYIVNGKKVIIK